ncbi:MAG: hypothetical protein ACE3JQ_07595 [Paenisporosarcina sp.]
MKKYWLLLASISLTATLLSACNTSHETHGEGSHSTANVAEEKTKDETATVENEDEQEESPAEETAIEDRGPEKPLTYKVNDEVKEETATLVNSDEQSYSIYKLEGFELTGEEPNKDSLYFGDNDAAFMRIETISKDDASMDIIRENLTGTMEAVGIASKPTLIADDSKLPQGNGISSQYGMEVVTEIGTISGIVFEQGNLIVRLTIFDRNNLNLSDAFLKMGETIAIKQ